MGRFLLLALLCWQGCILTTEVSASERIALVFGNASYRHASRLTNPANDATDVGSAFSRLGFAVNLVKDGTFDGMRRALLDFAQRAPAADIAVVYFAGHGMEIRDENWLIPVDAELRADFSAGHEAISLASILPIVSKARKLGLVLIDACRDNPFSRQLQVSSRNFASRGLISVEPPNSVLVVFAAKHGTTADDGSGRNSPFTRALLNNIETPGLEINYLFRHVHDEVLNETQRRQEPYVYGTLSKEPIYLKAPESAAPVSEAAHAWQSVKETSRPEVLLKFIESYGSTVYGELARERLAVLETNAAVSTKLPPAPIPAKPPAQIATLEAQPAAPPALPANLAAMAGRWTWRAECGMFGRYSGTVEQEVFPDGRFIGRRSNGEVVEGRISGNTVKGRHNVEGGVQNLRANLSQDAKGRYLVEGSFTDSRIPIGTCPYRQVKG